MFHKMIKIARDNWYESANCTINSLVEYMVQEGKMRDAQIDAIKTYLYLKIACGCDLAPWNRASYNVRKKRKKLTKELKEDGKKELHSRADYCQAAGGRTALQPGQDDR